MKDPAGEGSGLKMSVQPMGKGRVFRRLVLVAALLAAATVGLLGGAAGASNLTGASGLILVPSADILDLGTLPLGYHSPGSLSVGLGVTTNAETGVAMKSGGDLSPHFKLRILPEEAGHPGIALGLLDGAVYIVASHRLTPGAGRVHAGFAVSGTPAGPSPGLRGLFAGISLPLSSQAGGSSATGAAKGKAHAGAASWVLMLEYTGTGVNAGVRVDTAIPGLGIDLVLLDLNQPSLGAQYTIRF
ncbi:MAG: hypothetical protein HYY08_03500 [Firmicutes bacterium]|nr:hypothetical protein [Bacillota bacterium]